MTYSVYRRTPWKNFDTEIKTRGPWATCLSSHLRNIKFSKQYTVMNKQADYMKVLLSAPPPLKRSVSFYLNKLESLHSKDASCKIGWNCPGYFGEDSKMSSMYFRWSLLSPIWKSHNPMFEKTLIPLTQECLCAKFGWNWPSSSREDFHISLMLFRYYLPLEEGVILHLNMNPLYPRMLCAIVRNCSISFGKNENVKFTGGRSQTDAGQQVIKTARFSFQLRWSKNRHRILINNHNSFFYDYGILESLKISPWVSGKQK